MSDVAVSLLLPVSKASGDVPSGYKLIADSITEYGKTYNGPAEEVVFTFAAGPEQLDFVFNFLRDRYIADQAEALEDQGAHLVQVKVWRDISPTWKTLYRVALVADVRGESKLASPFPWLAVIGVGLVALVLYFLVKPVIESVTDLFWGREGEDGGVPVGGLAIAAIVGLALMGGKKTEREKKA